MQLQIMRKNCRLGTEKTKSHQCPIVFHIEGSGGNREIPTTLALHRCDFRHAIGFARYGFSRSLLFLQGHQHKRLHR